MRGPAGIHPRGDGAFTFGDRALAQVSEMSVSTVFAICGTLVLFSAWLAQQVQAKAEAASALPLATVA